MRDKKNKSNSISIIVSAIIIAVAILLIEMIGNFLFKNIELPKIITYIIRPIMYVITIAFTQFIIQKISAKIKKLN